MKPFRNETHFDPGRFRTEVTFFKQIDTLNEYGGTVQSYEEVKRYAQLIYRSRTTTSLQ